MSKTQIVYLAQHVANVRRVVSKTLKVLSPTPSEASCGVWRQAKPHPSKRVNTQTYKRKENICRWDGLASQTMCWVFAHRHKQALPARQPQHHALLNATLHVRLENTEACRLLKKMSSPPARKISYYRLTKLYKQPLATISQNYSILANAVSFIFRRP